MSLTCEPSSDRWVRPAPMPLGLFSPEAGPSWTRFQWFQDVNNFPERSIAGY